MSDYLMPNWGVYPPGFGLDGFLDPLALETLLADPLATIPPLETPMPSLGPSIPNIPAPSAPTDSSPKSTTTPSSETESKTPKKDGEAIKEEVNKVAAELGMQGKLKSGGSEEDMKKVIKKEGEKQGVTLETEEKSNVSESDVKAALAKSETTGVVLMGNGHAVCADKSGDIEKVAHQGQNGSCWAHAAVRAAQVGSGSSSASGSGDVKVADSGDGQKKSLGQALSQLGGKGGVKMLRAFKKDKGKA